MSEADKILRVRRLFPELEAHTLNPLLRRDFPVMEQHNQPCTMQRRSFPELEFTGQAYQLLPDRPTILTGPTATDITATSAFIEWTTDYPAYHRIQWKQGGGSWTTTAWTLTTDTDASIYISGLASENTTHYFNVQSCWDTGDLTTYCDWDDGDEATTHYFSTLCLGTGMDATNITVSKQGFGKLAYLKVTWNTGVTLSWGQTDGSVSTLDYGPGTITLGTSHSKNYTSFTFREGDYWIRIRNRNNCGVWGSYSSPYTWFHVDAAGNVQQL